METWVVSRCLLGISCRYDGQAKPCPAVMAFLESRHAQVIDLCPECDCGMPCPRPPMTVSDNGSALVLSDNLGTDHTAQMKCWIDSILPKLSALNPSGFILKSRSPSCGVKSLQIDGREHPGDGLFAAAVQDRFPQSRILSETALPGGAEVYSQEKLLQKVRLCVQRLLASSPGCHDWDHTLRVYRNAQSIMEIASQSDTPCVPVDALTVQVAALMHDIGRPRELSDCGATNHAVYGAVLAAEWLSAIGLQDTAFIQHVCDCIRSHRYRKRPGNLLPETPEARIVYDADKLDSIGAIGIGRSFHFAGRTGARVHNTAEEALAGASYGHEDSAYREYLVKLRHVQDAMLTSAGRALAEQRHAFMVEFFDELNRECFG